MQTKGKEIMGRNHKRAIIALVVPKPKRPRQTINWLWGDRRRPVLWQFIRSGARARWHVAPSDATVGAAAPVSSLGLACSGGRCRPVGPAGPSSSCFAYAASSQLAPHVTAVAMLPPFLRALAQAAVISPRRKLSVRLSPLGKGSLEYYYKLWKGRQMGGYLMSATNHGRWAGGSRRTGREAASSGLTWAPQVLVTSCRGDRSPQAAARRGQPYTSKQP